LTPTATRPQLLPLGSLLPKDFERLCFRLARLDASVVSCRLYGIHGQAQQGIDLYAREHNGTYKVVQCKRSSDDFTASEITNAVDTFLAGDWSERAAAFVLAVTANLEPTQLADRIETERTKLAEHGIAFDVWGETEISAVMKDHPRLVDDFFGREAVKVFLGHEAADALGERLDAAEVAQFRVELRALYREVFGRLERGVHGDERNVALPDRFVLPDVLVGADTTIATLALDPPQQRTNETALRFGIARSVPDVTAALRGPMLIPAEAGPLQSRYAARVQVTDWLNSGTWHVVVGAPGSGKSALLRTLVLDVFADEPQLIGDLDRWHELLPVWLPFAFWTHAVRMRPDAASVLDGVREWLTAYDHGHLTPMIEKALRDERLLLVVDGLDEWASPDLARLCVDRLEVFAGAKHVNLVASSRPFSTAELPLDRQRWRQAELAPLSQDQRRDFIVRWLAPLIAEPALSAEANSWAREIDSAVHLRELSDLPLFLLLLLRTREQRTEFPEDLYAVLAEAVTRLVGEHRRRKIDVAGAPDIFPSTGDVRKVSAAAAERMHLSSILSISDDELRDLFRRTLSDSIGYPAAAAHAMASALVNSLSPGVGLMIRPAPDETRFFHRSVLEFLAAERLLAKASTEHLLLFQQHLTDRSWSQVLRFLIRGLARPAEVTAIFDVLDAVGTDDPLLKEHQELLATDVVVSAGPADARTRRRLHDRVIKEIETGERLPHQAQLIDKIVHGLARPEMRAGLLTRFEAWLRAVPRETWASVLQAASHWQPDDLLLDVLWCALLSDSDMIQRVASRLLGSRFGDNNDVADRLDQLAATTRLPGRRAAAVEAISIGWPHHDVIDSLIALGRDNADFAVRHSAIAADLRRGNITDVNRSALMELLDHAPTFTAWSDGIMELMFTHYPDDQAIFEHYVQQADPTTTNQIRYGHVPAMSLILTGYTRRPEAKEFFLKFIAADRPDFRTSPSNLTDHLPWKEIGQVYGADGEVAAAVERLVDEYGTDNFHNRDLYFCSQVARTTKLRNRLVAAVESREGFGIGWAIKALLEGWPDSLETNDALGSCLDNVNGPVPDGAIWYLPDIIADPDAALDALVTIAPAADDQNAVVFALSEILKRGGTRTDPRTTAILDRALAHDMTKSWASTEATLYKEFPDHPGVRELALTRINHRNAPLASIAYGFRTDRQIREILAARLKPLNAPLRGRLVEALADAPPVDTGVTLLLSRYDFEPDPTVKLLAAVAYAGRLVATHNITDKIVDDIAEQVHARGIDYAERSAAAFGALVSLGRLDKLTGQTHHSFHGDTTLFFRLICRYWEDVKASLGDDLPYRLGYNNAPEFWQNVLAVAHDYPVTRDDLATLLEEQPTLAVSTGGVVYLSKVEPGSDRLWRATTDLLRRTQAIAYVDIQPAWSALNILEDQFAEDPRTSAWLNAMFTPVAPPEALRDRHAYVVFRSFGMTAALARLQPEHPAIRELLIWSQRVEGQPWAFHEWTELTAATTPDAQRFVDLAVEISHIVRINDMFPEYIHRPLTARLRRDPTLAASVAGLVPELTGAAFGIAVRLLSLSANLGGPLVAHLQSRLSTPADRPSDTFDPLVGRTRNTKLLILDILDTTGT
jgi:hypothetical protein